MKKLITCLFIIFVGILFANPIAPVCISEFTFDESTWTMEIFDYYEFGIANLNGCSIETFTCTSYFDDGITCNENGVFVVTENDVQTPFIFDHEGDHIIFDSPSSGLWDEISFGNYVNAPYDGQSLARYVYNYGSPGFEDIGFGLVKESPPTFGSDPFSVYSFGIFTGYVYDSMSNPVANVNLGYNSGNSNIYTDETGYFSTSLLGKNYDFNIHLSTLASIDTTITIEPDSTYYYEFVFENYVSSDDIEIELASSQFNLSNYPNPFNPTTEISFETTNLHENARIEIYNSRGQKIKTISVTLSGVEMSQNTNQLTSSPSSTLRMTQAGSFNSVTWDGTNSIGKICPSGVYLYKLVSGEKELAANKMLLLK